MRHISSPVIFPVSSYFYSRHISSPVMASSLARFLARVPPILYPQRSTLRLPCFHLQRYRSQSPVPLLVARSVASSVSNKPASQSLPHAITNAKEEAGNSASDLAKTIAGNITSAETALSKSDTFVSRICRNKMAGSLNLVLEVGITSAIAANVPRHVLTMGLAGKHPVGPPSLVFCLFVTFRCIALPGNVPHHHLSCPSSRPRSIRPCHWRRSQRGPRLP